MHPDIESVLLSRDLIQTRVRELAQEISREYEERDLHLICVLRGAALFASDLLRELSLDATIDFISISSYGPETRSSGVVRLLKDLEDPVESRHLLVVEDIIDTGLTLNYLLDLLRARKPASVEVCTLLDKPDARRGPCCARYTGFFIPNAFVVGYGLDYNQKYRALPYIGRLRPHIYGGN